MSLLKEKIQADFKKALKGRQEAEIRTLRLLSAAILTREKEKRGKIATKKPELSEKELQLMSQLTDEEILEVIISEAKKRKEAILAFDKGGREDLVEREAKELKILKRYLPEQLTEKELKQLIEKVIQEIGAQGPKDIGKVMAALMPQIKARADTSLAAKIVKEMLQELPLK